MLTSWGSELLVVIMKFGLRIPLLRKRFAARTSIVRIMRHNFGMKAPKGLGWVTNPKRALYNKIYYKMTFGLDALIKFFLRKNQ